MTTLNYRIHGEGAPLIILHGLFGSARNWYSIAKALCKDRRVITVDLRNHGESEHTTTMTYPDMVEDIRELVEKLDLSSATIIGHSMGGKVAMGVALTFPEMADALIVVDIAPANYDSTSRELIDAMQSLSLADLKNRLEADKQLESAGVTDHVIRQFLLQNLVRSVDGYAWRLNLPTIGQHLDELASFPQTWPTVTYNGPACFMAGGESDYILPRHYSYISGLFPKATVCTIEDAGHWIHADKPEKFINAVRDFLTD